MKIFIGYDTREDIAYQVCKYSILEKHPELDIVPLNQQQLRNSNLYWRDVDPLSSTEFTFTRFLIPAIMNYEGWAMFCDCDFIWNTSLEDLFNLINDQYAVMVVKHNYVTTTKIKMDDKIQYQYPRKNWSSMMLFNCSHPANKKLDLQMVNNKSGQFLHQFKWLDDSLIGEIPFEWNWLVGHYKSGTPKAIHYTEGGPWFEKYRNCEYSSIWKQYLNRMLDENRP